ncbi:MAG TPA: cellulase family glycosylhydrolase [bacterium]|nr:cellulase family glycosylhydrolase [bacterium]
MTPIPLFRPVGFNLGGWISQSDLSDARTRSFIRKEDLRTIAAWGFNSVRLPVDAPWLFEDEGRGPLNKKRLALLKKFLGWAREAGLMTILDLHQVPWHSFARPEQEDLWKDEKALDAFCGLWAELAHALKRQKGGLWFDVLNEPTAKDPQDWNHVASRIYRVLRMEDPKRTLMIESTFWGLVTNLPALAEAVQGPNLVYSFHFYIPMFVTHQGTPWWKDGHPYPETVAYPGALPRVQEYLARDLPPVTREFLAFEGAKPWDRERLRETLQPAIRLVKEGHPVYCGEFGVYEQVARSTRLNWVRDVVGLFTEHGIGWGYWNYKWLDFGIWPPAANGKSGPLDEEMLRILQSGITPGKT